MLKQVRPGNLDLSTARIGAVVRCTGKPNITYWDSYFKYQKFIVPVPGTLYHIRAGLMVPFRGILLLEVKNPEVNMTYLPGIPFSGEPFFEYRVFNFVRFEA